jgi:hypothetical protein
MSITWFLSYVKSGWGRGSINRHENKRETVADMEGGKEKGRQERVIEQLIKVHHMYV